MGMNIMCPWCFEVNNLPRDGSVFCKKCYHRADVSPKNCDCLACKPPPWAPSALTQPEALKHPMPDLPDLAELLPPIPPSLSTLEPPSLSFSFNTMVWAVSEEGVDVEMRLTPFGLWVDVESEIHEIIFEVPIIERSKLIEFAKVLVNYLSWKELQHLSEVIHGKM